MRTILPVFDRGVKGVIAVDGMRSPTKACQRRSTPYLHVHRWSHYSHQLSVLAFAIDIAPRAITLVPCQYVVESDIPTDRLSDATLATLPPGPQRINRRGVEMGSWADREAFGNAYIPRRPLGVACKSASL